MRRPASVASLTWEMRKTCLLQDSFTWQLLQHYSLGRPNPRHTRASLPRASPVLPVHGNDRLPVSSKVADLDALPERVNTIGQKLDALSASVDRRFEEVDKRFDAVDGRFEDIDRRFEDIDRRFEDIDRRFDGVDEHFAEQRRYTEFAFERLEQGLAANTARLERVEHVVAANASGLARLERKLDQLIDSQSTPASRARSAKPKKR